MSFSIGHSLKTFFWHSRGVWLVTPLVAGAVMLLRMSGVLQGWEWTTYDLYLRLRPQEEGDRRVVIVGINETDLAKLNSSIISDQTLATLLTKLKAREPRAIGLDMYRDLPVPPGEQALSQVFATTPNLIGIQKVVGEIGKETVAPPSVLKKKGQVGANDLPIDADNRIRRGFFYLSDGKDNVYSFALLLAGLYLDKQGISPQAVPQTDNWRIGQAVFVPFETNDGGYVGADARGFQILLNYRDNPRPFEMVSMTDILQNRVPADWGRDRVILIGKVGESFKDVFFTPYSDLLGLAKTVPGVEVHASLVSQILSASLDGRPLIHTIPDFLEDLWVLLWSLIGAAIAWQFRYREGHQRSPVLAWGLVLFAGGTLFGSTYGAMLYGWWLPRIPPFLALLGSAVAMTAYIARSGIQIRKTFGRYLTDEVVANLLENPEGLKIGGERRQITILTSDLRGFTATSERLSPEKVIQVLNFYFGHMADVITKYQGTIDEFMGDGILVLFGAPTHREDDAERAVACAIEMQLIMTKVNEQMTAWEFNPLVMGIGINTGEVVVGNIGSEKRTKYGVVGNQVNLTYRIESYTTGGQVLISDSTYQLAKDKILINGSKEVQPKGIQEAITIYDVAGMKEPYNLQLIQEAEIAFSLPDPITLLYAPLEGKHVTEIFSQGTLQQLSNKGGEILAQGAFPVVPPALTNLKIKLMTADRNLSDDLYAKVVDKPCAAGSFWIYFTAKPPPLETHFHQLYESLKSA